MRSNWTAEQINGLFSCNLPDSWCASGVSIDTRNLQAGQIYVAIKGAKLDGHDFVNAAAQAGASAALVDHWLEGVDDFPQIIVPDVLEGLRTLAAAARQRTQAKIVGVTGSVGKTSTKEALLFVLQNQGETYATQRSFNNHWGLPLTVANLPQDACYGVIEMGMNHRGEISGHTQLARPHVAYITNIEAMHLGNLGSIQAIAEAKAEIFEGLIPGGICILNADSHECDLLEAAARKDGASQVWFIGSSSKADIRLYESEVFTDHQVIHADIAGEKITYSLNLMGNHWALNSLGILAVVKALGADVALAATKLAEFKAVAGRGQVHEVGLSAAGQIRIIDESYNAGPVSMKAAIHVLGQACFPGKFRRIAVLGDMYEIGDCEVEEHKKLAQSLMEQKVDVVYTCGPLMASLHEALPSHMRGLHENDPRKLASHIIDQVRSGDIYMVKGSRGGYQEKGRMYAVVDALLNIKNGVFELAI